VSSGREEGERGARRIYREREGRGEVAGERGRGGWVSSRPSMAFINGERTWGGRNGRLKLHYAEGANARLGTSFDAARDSGAASGLLLAWCSGAGTGRWLGRGCRARPPNGWPGRGCGRARGVGAVLGSWRRPFGIGRGRR
jgi:hypothetical protein